LPRSRALTVLAVIAAVVLIAVAVVYWAEPASSLPSWWPGHKAGSGHHHTKHGIAAFLLGLACLAYAWFQTGKRPGQPVKRPAA
jgi:Spy/CpxP family protein refolding chaperone